MEIVVLSPHRDDAAFSLSLSIASWLGDGHSVRVLNCFTLSEYAPYDETTSSPHESLAGHVSALRMREDHAWMERMTAGTGRKLDVLSLDLNDAPLRLFLSVDEVCEAAVAPQDNAFEKVRLSLEKLLPCVLVIPLAVGSHVDHATARDAALSLDCNAFPCALYEDLPYAARPGAAAEIEKLAHSLDAKLQPFFTTSAKTPKAAADFKRQLALCYRSQIDYEVADQISAFSGEYAGRERLWVNTAWQNSSMAAGHGSHERI